MGLSKQKIRNAILGLAVALGFAAATQNVKAFSCSVEISCGGFSLYCWCENASWQADCGPEGMGCYVKCDGSELHDQCY